MAAGGLHIIGTERHESRRIDNQLRGRSGRQGDPGSSRFYLCAGGSAAAHLRRRPRAGDHGSPEDAGRRSRSRRGIVTRSIENAQRKVEARNFDIRKQLLEYDDVVQRPAQGDLPAAQRNAGSDRHHRHDRERCATACFADTRAPSSCRPSQRRRAVGRRRPRGRCCADEWSARDASRSRKSSDDSELDRRRRDRREASSPRPTRHYEAKVALVGQRERSAQFERSVMLQTHRHPLARAPGRARLPAPGHPPARLCAEATRSRNTSARLSNCSARCSIPSSTKSRVI